MSRYLHHYTDDLDLPNPLPVSKSSLSRPALSVRAPAPQADRIDKISKLRDQELVSGVSLRLERLSRSLDPQTSEDSLKKRYRRLAKTKRFTLDDEEASEPVESPSEDYRKVYDSWNEHSYLEAHRPRIYEPGISRGRTQNSLLLEEANEGLGLETNKIHSILDVIRTNIEEDGRRESTRKELDSFAVAIGKLSLPIFRERAEYDLDFATRLEQMKVEYQGAEKLVSSTFGHPNHLVCPPSHYPLPSNEAAGTFGRTREQGGECPVKEVSSSRRYPTVGGQALTWAKERLTRIEKEIMRDRTLDENMPNIRIRARPQARDYDREETDCLARYACPSSLDGAVRYARPSSLDGAAGEWISVTPYRRHVSQIVAK